LYDQSTSQGHVTQLSRVTLFVVEYRYVIIAGKDASNFAPVFMHRTLTIYMYLRSRLTIAEQD